jgi:oligopeptide/dipeptide ABC transporter ATP-binding protein
MTSAATTPSTSATEPLLRLRGVSKRFPVERDLWGRPTHWLSAVDDVDLDVSRGETVALVGESGSGKSTLARLALRLIEPSAGTIEFAGEDILGRSGRALQQFRTQAQIIFQDPFGSLDPRMKVGAIVAEGMGHLQLDRAARRKRVHELLELVHLPSSAVDRFPHEFSGGQRQRVSIARALAVDPTFIVADEPVSALDVSVQSHVLNLLMELRDELGLTYLFVSHDMSVVRHIADRVAVMYLGQVVELAPTETLFANPRHPYTQVLLSSVPSLIREGADERIMLEGDIPSPIDPPEACRFAGRCFRSIERCTAEVPPLEPIDADERAHLGACFNPVPRAAAAVEHASHGG